MDWDVLCFGALPYVLAEIRACLAKARVDAFLSMGWPVGCELGWSTLRQSPRQLEQEAGYPQGEQLRWSYEA